MSSTLRWSRTSSRRSRSATSISTSSEARSSGERSTVAATMSPRRARILVLVEHLRRLVRDVRRDGDELLGHVVDGHAEAVDLDRVLADLDQRLVRREQVGLLLYEAGHAAPLGAAQHGRDAVLGRLHDADDLAFDADGVEIRAGGLFDVGVLLGADQDARAFAAERLDQAQRAGAADLDRHHRAGEQHQVAEREEREGLRGVTLMGGLTSALGCRGDEKGITDLLPGTGSEAQRIAGQNRRTSPPAVSGGRTPRSACAPPRRRASIFGATISTRQS